MKLALLQRHLERAPMFVGELLEEEVEEEAGKRYSHDDSRLSLYSRWGTTPGSVRIGEEKGPITVPRMRDIETEETFSPERDGPREVREPIAGGGGRGGPDYGGPPQGRAHRCWLRWA